LIEGGAHIFFLEQADAVADRDWEAVASLCPDDLVEHDNRSLSSRPRPLLVARGARRGGGR